MRIATWVLLLLSCAWVPAGTALAEGNAEAAKSLISERCTACHEVPGLEPRFEKAEVNAPAFQMIADDSNTYTDQRLRDFLQSPHWPMTQFILSPSDVDNVIAFIHSLR